MKEQRTTAVWALAGLFLAAAFAGCTGFGKAGAGNEAPTADLAASKEVAWNGERVNFDGSKSSDPDGDITSWKFDFGDNTTMEVKRKSEAANVTHTYLKGGEYTVTLTVTDDGKDRVGSLTDTDAKTVAVNERQPVSAQVVQAAPPGRSSNATSNKTQQFQVGKGVDRTEVSLTVSSLLVAGSSRVQIRVVDPEGRVIAERDVTVDAGQQKQETLNATLEKAGTVKVEMTATSGASRISGEARFYYDEGFEVETSSRSPSPTATT